ncbi:uncharacterized protein LOC129597865 isoform X2 [Paramacrobiotus metropolitanus]|nr:uncharacterized protein LOC129597865 isoform X2 [Paramacrobiotus metropolitanus]
MNRIALHALFTPYRSIFPDCHFICNTRPIYPLTVIFFAANHICHLGIVFINLSKMNVAPTKRLRTTPAPREWTFFNYVIVQRESGVWWLGCITDIDTEGEQYFIDFMSTTVPSGWIHTRYIWTYEHISDHLPLAGPRGDIVPAHIAIRANANGPLVIRAGRVIRSGTELGYVTLDERDETGMLRCHVVRKYQVLARLPAPNEEPFFGRRNGLVWTKKVIPFDKAHQLRWLSWLRFCVQDAFPPRLGREMFDGQRMYVRVEEDRVTFIFYEQHSQVPGNAVLCDEDTLYRSCTEKHSSRCIGPAKKPATDCSVAVRRLRVHADPGDSCQFESLSVSVIKNVLLHLDLLSQFTAKSVCALWRAILAEPDTGRHLVLDANVFQLRERELFGTVHDNHAYRKAMALEAAITTQTRSIIYISIPRIIGITHDDPWEKLLFHLLQIKGIVLEKFNIKGRYGQLRVLSAESQLPEATYKYSCDELLRLMPVCHQLILVDCTLENVIHNCNYTYPRIKNSLLPKLFAQKYYGDYDRPRRDVTVDRCVLRCSDSPSQV